MKTININGHEVPQPMRHAPEYGSIYYMPVVQWIDRLFTAPVWMDDSRDLYLLDRGLCHATREAAEAHARALLSFTTTEPNQ